MDGNDRRDFLLAAGLGSAALALATALGTAAGRNVDDPDWTAAYYATARTTGEVSA